MGEIKNLSRPDESLSFDHGRAEFVVLGDLTVGRSIIQPGWRWSTHIKPMAGTEWCESNHVGVQLTGRAHVLLRDGSELAFGPDDVFHIPPGHDAWVVGDDPVTTIEWSGLRGWVPALESMNERVLATVVFTDIVDSTATASRVGDSRWQELLSRHNVLARDVLSRFRGREVETTGDGFLAVFDGAARAVRCASALVSSAAAEGLAIRAAVHTGEVELAGDGIRGVSVHEAARILGLTGPGKVLVSAITRALSVAAGLSFEDRGEHELKGLTGPRQMFAFIRADPGVRPIGG